MNGTRTAAVIGSTGRGNYGQGHDTVFLGLEGVELVAIADDNAQGLEATAKRTNAPRTYRDYREMLSKEKPFVVAIGPRWVDQRVAMIEAAVAAGCHIYCEKPLAGNLADADRIIRACERANVKLAVAHQTRAVPPVRLALAHLQQGKFGKLVRLRARGKEDIRGGGEDLIVLGTHMLDLMTLFAGTPRWVSANVTVGGRPAAVADKRRPTEPVGMIVGDAISASYGFDGSAVASFHSRANVSRPGRSPFGLVIECEEAMVSIRSGEVFLYPSSVVVPENSKLAWQKLWVEDWHFFPDHKPRPMGDWLHRGNQILVRDLLRAVTENRPPISSGADARWALEMIQGVYAAHFAGRRLPLPLHDRKHPLEE
jgi:predicted dehydrogenase